MTGLKAKFLLIQALILSVCLPAYSQFFSYGTDPAGLKWLERSTAHYRIIYPDYADSLALEYARNLEKSWSAVGLSAGFSPTGTMKGKLPVILHTQSAESNGSVAWAPSRIEFYTTPDCFSPLSVPWIQHLVIHESRHATQMQFAYDRKFKAGRILFGELFPSVMVALYPETAFMEGDAVAAETALTTSGRGRTAFFLNYYRVCFSQGDFRNYWRWRYGSNKLYTPDLYRAGYLKTAGIRALYNVPDLTERYYRRVIEKPWFPVDNFNKTLKETTGRDFRTAWAEVCDSLAAQWKSDSLVTAPFNEMRPVTSNHRRYTEYTGTTSMGGCFYAVRSGLDRTSELISIDESGRTRRLHSIGGKIMGLKADRKRERLVWTETVSDARWEMRSYSVVRFYTPEGKVKSLTRKSRYWNVCIDQLYNKYAVIEYPASGGCAVVILDPESGKEIERVKAPGNIELTDIAFGGERLFVSGIDSTGSCIWELHDGFEKIFGGIPSTISSLQSGRLNNIHFNCDASGVSEIYSLDFNSKICFKLTNTPFGCDNSYVFGDSLYLSTLNPGGKNIFVTNFGNYVDNYILDSVKTSFIASSIANQEKGNFACEKSSPQSEPGQAHRYSKMKHLIRFHSWAPVFVNYNSIESISFSSLWSDVGLGASLFFQNDLGSASGFIGYHATPGKDKWQHSGHLKFNYSGWYPVFELEASVNERSSLHYSLTREETEEGMNVYKISAANCPKPLLYGSITAYIPWKYNSGGISRGFIPQISYTVTNDLFSGIDGSPETLMQRMTLSARGYIMRNVPSSCIYPRLGLGFEAGASFRPGMTDVFKGNSYVFCYAYLPGIIRTHGIKLTAMAENHFGGGMFSESYLNVLPRGFSDTSVLSELAKYDTRTKFSFDYALPLGNVDWSFLCPVAYIRNFELFLHGDCAAMFSASGERRTLFSTGADFNVVLGNLLWIPYTTRIGVTYDWTGSSHYVGMTFGISL